MGEELGLDLPGDALVLFGELVRDNRFEWLWMSRYDQTVNGSPAIGLDVSDFRWAGKAEICAMVGRGEFVGYSYRDSLP